MGVIKVFKRYNLIIRIIIINIIQKRIITL